MQVPPGLRSLQMSRNNALGSSKLSRPDEMMILSNELDSKGRGPSNFETSNDSSLLLVDAPEGTNKFAPSPNSNMVAPSKILLPINWENMSTTG